MTIKVSGGNANELHKILIEGQDFSIKPLDPNDPVWDWVIGKDDPLLSEVNKVDIEELTTREFGGEGSFDALMESSYEHIKKEYDNDRITGDDYAKAYTSVMEAAMANATQFALQKDLIFWQAIAGKMQAYSAYVGFQTAKMLYRTQLFDSLNAEARYANTKMDTLYKESIYRTSEWNLDNMLPVQKQLTEEQVEGQVVSNDTGKWNLSNMLPSQKSLVDAQTDNQTANTDTIEWTLKERLPKDKELVEKQIKGQEISNNSGEFSLENILPQQYKLLQEQTESERAQTLDIRTDGAVIKGSIGKQKDLYSQQIDSYKRDAEYKVGKYCVDAFITMKTIDEGLKAPNIFTNSSIDTILGNVRKNVGL